MTPPATAALRSSDRSQGSRRAPVRHPRRISGPAGPRAATAAAAVAIPAPGIALPRRRPARPAVQPRPRRGKAARGSRRAGAGIALRAVGALEDISASALFDRLIRGRAWIGLLAFALIGIVAMQLLVLELNTGVGRTLGRIATLQRQNAQLGIEDSTYSAENKVAPLAAAAGMTLAPPGAVHFVVASPGDFSRAAAALSTAIQPQTSQTEPSKEASGGTASTAETESSTESASSESPSTAHPSTESHSTESASTESRSTESPSTESPSTESPSTGSSSTESPSPRAGG